MSEDNKKYVVIREPYISGMTRVTQTSWITCDLNSIADSDIIRGNITIYEISKKINISLSRTIVGEDL